MRVVGVVHGGDVGQQRRPHIVVVIGGDAHELRALDQKRGVADKSDPHLIGIERRDGMSRGWFAATGPGQPVVISGLAADLGDGASTVCASAAAGSAQIRKLAAIARKNSMRECCHELR